MVYAIKIEVVAGRMKRGQVKSEIRRVIYRKISKKSLKLSQPVFRKFP